MQRVAFIFFSLLVVMVLSGTLISCRPSNSTAAKVEAPPGPHPVCQSQAQENDPGIFGGHKVAKNSQLGKSLVAVLITDFYSRKSICSGVLVDRNLVLTAAHCADPYMAMSLKIAFTTESVADISSLANADQILRKVTKRAVHPGFSRLKEMISDDIALIRFEGEAPADYQTLSLINEPIAMQECTQVLLSGYGSQTEYNTKEPQVFDLNSTRVFPYFGKQVAKSGLQMENSPKFYLDQRFGTGACIGDSGGPAMLETPQGLRVIGVASTVDPLEDRDFRLQSDVTCRKGIAYTSVLFYQDWIEKSFNELKDPESEKISLFEF